MVPLLTRCGVGVGGAVKAETDFGQSDFGHPYLTDFGQIRLWPTLIGRLWPSRLWPKLLFQSFGGAKGWGRRRVGGPKFRAFSSLAHHRFALFVSLWVSSRGILVVFEALGLSNVHVWALWLLCETPAASGPPPFKAP